MYALYPNRAVHEPDLCENRTVCEGALCANRALREPHSVRTTLQGNRHVHELRCARFALFANRVV